MLYVTVYKMLILDKTIVLWGTKITGIPSIELEQDRQERKQGTFYSEVKQITTL